MFNRREALCAMGAAVVGGFTSGIPAFGGSPQSSTNAPQSTPETGSLDDRLRKELAPREYSEEGVPVFLACEDLTKRPELGELNAALASEMRRNAEAMKRVKPDVAAGDVAKLIEILATRDFQQGETRLDASNPAPSFLENAGTLAELFATNPVIRAVNFHNTSKAQAELYDRQLAAYSQHFTSVSQDDLDQYMSTGKWHKPKPGLIVSVFEGYRNSLEVLVPIIEKYGFIAWFSMITNFINRPVADQLNYAEHHDIDMLTHEYPDGRYAMTWEDLRKLDRKHVIVSHSRSHTLLSALPPEEQRSEVIGSQEDFKKNLGHPVRMFVSLTGPAYGENEAIDRLVREAGYDLVLSNFRIQRISAKHT